VTFLQQQLASEDNYSPGRPWKKFVAGRTDPLYIPACSESALCILKAMTHVKFKSRLFFKPKSPFASGRTPPYPAITMQIASPTSCAVRPYTKLNTKPAPPAKARPCPLILSITSVATNQAKRRKKCPANAPDQK